MLTRERVRALYDRRGARQDRSRALTGPALEALLAHGEFGSARAVFELGPGTGRLAEHLLALSLPVAATYTGVDLSETMVALARQRLDRFGGRVSVRHGSGDPVIDADDGAYDRVVCAYVLELLPPPEIDAFLAEAHRVLAPAPVGMLCVACLAGGAWRAAAMFMPGVLAGCRPLDLGAHLDADRWELVHTEVVRRLGVASRVLVARRR